MILGSGALRLLVRCKAILFLFYFSKFSSCLYLSFDLRDVCCFVGFFKLRGGLAQNLARLRVFMMCFLSSANHIILITRHLVIPWFPSYTLNPKITTCTWVISLRNIISHYCRRVRSKSHQMSHHLPSQPQLIITCWYFLCVIKHPQIPPFFAVKVAVCSLGWIWRE